MRTVLDRIYRRVRQVDAGIDPRLETRDLIEFAVGRAVSRARALASPTALGFRGQGVTVRGRRYLRVGTHVAVADHVLLDCTSERGIALGDHVTVDRFAALRASGVVRRLGTGIAIGDRSAVGAFNVVLGQGGVEIGTDCLLGPNVTIVSEEHVYGDRDRPIRDQGEIRDPVVIGDDVWVGAGATVLSGSRIGRGVVVAAGSVVKGTVEDYAVVAGVPARVVRRRGDVPGEAEVPRYDKPGRHGRDHHEDFSEVAVSVPSLRRNES